jgi:hypothetical protein
VNRNCDKISREQTRTGYSGTLDDELKELPEHLVVMESQSHRIDFLQGEVCRLLAFVELDSARREFDFFRVYELVKVVPVVFLEQSYLSEFEVHLLHHFSSDTFFGRFSRHRVATRNVPLVGEGDGGIVVAEAPTR